MTHSHNHTAARLVRNGPVAELILCRPERLNALDPDMLAALRAHLDSLATDRSVRVVILRGEGDAFMAGGDIGSFAQALHQPPAERDARITALLADAQTVALALANLPMPVIAAVHGAVAGYGVGLLCACDLAIAADDLTLTTAYARIGLSPDGGVTWWLARLLGQRKAKELVLLADRLDATAAAALGLVNQVVRRAQLQDEAHALAERLAAGPALAQRHAKALLASAETAPLQSQLDAEASAFAACATTPDFAEGVRAFLEKRAPKFTGQ